MSNYLLLVPTADIHYTHAFMFVGGVSVHCARAWFSITMIWATQRQRVR